MLQDKGIVTISRVRCLRVGIGTFHAKRERVAYKFGMLTPRIPAREFLGISMPTRLLQRRPFEVVRSAETYCSYVKSGCTETTIFANETSPSPPAVRCCFDGTDGAPRAP